jgi:lycopene cyclase domain-containing protein
MSLYLIINLIIIAFPLLLSLLPRFGFYRKLRPLGLSILIVGGLFIFWDVLATQRGDWSFNPLYVSGFKLFGLPYEEWLFFFTVPYSCVFLYEGMIKVLIDKKVFYQKTFYLLLAAASLVLSLFFTAQPYTASVCLVTGLVFLTAVFLFEAIFSSRLFWLWLSAGMVLFFIFNYFLTSLPVVAYNPKAITNLRIITIPIEDFFYNFSLLSLYLAVYLKIKRLFV